MGDSMNTPLDQDTKSIEPRFKWANVYLCLLTIAVIWLALELGSLKDTGSAYMQNSDSGYTAIRTRFGNFPVLVSETKAAKDGTEMTLTIVNPLVIHFNDARVSVETNGTIESKTIDLAPSSNTAKFKVAPLNRGDTIKVYLDLDGIAFK